MTADHHVVHLLGVPPLLVVRHRRHVDDLVHELQIVQLGQRQGRDVAPALAGAIHAILEHYAVPHDGLFKQARDAAERGDPTADLEIPLPAEAADAADAMLRLLEEGDALARAGLVLTLPAPDDVRRFRRWATGEIRRQLAGDPPVPFQQAVAHRGDSRPETGPGGSSAE